MYKQSWKINGLKPLCIYLSFKNLFLMNFIKIYFDLQITLQRGSLLKNISVPQLFHHVKKKQKSRMKRSCDHTEVG